MAGDMRPAEVKPERGSAAAQQRVMHCHTRSPGLHLATAIRLALYGTKENAVLAVDAIRYGAH